jgi:predicted ATP-dependent endonuclease of OLD family
MKLKSFRILNYKSIKDSGVCFLSKDDNILTLAGQNESGKSSVLQALADFDTGELHPSCSRKYDSDNSITYPSMECAFDTNGSEDLDVNQIIKDLEVSEDIAPFFNNLKEFTLTRIFTSPTESVIKVDNQTHSDFISLIKKVNEKINKNNPKPEINAGATEKEDEGINENLLDENINQEDIGDQLFAFVPKIILFDDWKDLLPDKILITSLQAKDTSINGYEPVKNIETILGASLTKLATLDDGVRESCQGKYNRTITTDFNERWRQKIFDDSKVEILIQYNQGGQDGGGPYLNFFIVTKEGELLTPQQRSQGLKWFLSFYLRLKAESKINDQLIILFDEPGLFLHSKAQGDIKGLFEELAEKDQIIYSTHSPYLIDSQHLNRVRLVLNDKDLGTRVEKITTKISNNQQDALRPIIDAIGLDIADAFSPVSKRNVIVEGISDFYYFMAMKKILNCNLDFAFIPSIGASQSHLLMELCIGWSLDWLIVFDDDSQSKSAYRSIKKQFFDNDEAFAKEKIYRTEGIDGVENMFETADLNLVDSNAGFNISEKNSDHVSSVGGKVLFSRFFYEKVIKGEIKKSELSETCINNFSHMFNFIENKFTPSLPAIIVAEPVGTTVSK